METEPLQPGWKVTFRRAERLIEGVVQSVSRDARGLACAWRWCHPLRILNPQRRRSRRWAVGLRVVCPILRA